MEIKIEVPKKIVIHNITKMDISGLLKSVRTPAGTMPLMWAKGYAFVVNALPLQGKALELYIEGELHYTDIIFSKMEDYKEVVEADIDLKANVFDMSKSAIHNAMADAIKQYDALIL